MSSWFPSGNIYLLLLSGGTGSRMRSELPKQFLELNGKPILIHSLQTLIDWGKTKSIVLVSHKDYILRSETLCSPYLRERDRIVEGGDTRHGSTLAGISSIQFSANDIILIHDAARPFVSPDDLDRLSSATEKFGVATLASKNHETVLEEVKDGLKFLNRDKIWFMKTPQGIRGDILKEILEKPSTVEPTDLCTWAQEQGIGSRLVESNPYNLKITEKSDLSLAEAIQPLFQNWKNEII